MKKITLLFFMFCIALAGAQNLANGLKACYPFDANGQNYAPTGATLNGTLTNAAPTIGHTGIANTAYRLNGTVGSYIALPDNPGLKSDSVFFSGWFRVDSFPSIQSLSALQYLVYTTNGCNSNFEAYSLDTYYNPSLGQHLFRVSKCGSDCGNKPQISAVTGVVAGSWYHVCFYITNSVMKLYVNGVFQSSASHNVQFGYQPGYNVYLGVTNQPNFNRPFKGAVDNVRFYNRELSQQEIMQLYTLDPACIESHVSLSEKDLPAPGILIYPNPATDRVQVEGLGENTLLVYDVLGRQVTYTKNQVTDGMHEINLQGAAPGAYLVKIISPHGNYMRTTRLVLVQ